MTIICSAWWTAGARHDPHQRRRGADRGVDALLPPQSAAARVRARLRRQWRGLIIAHPSDAGIAQLVERNLAKVEVARSRLVSRSIFLVPPRRDGRVVMQRPAKPWTPVRFRLPPPSAGPSRRARERGPAACS